jgi:tRNA modification GTPase
MTLASNTTVVAQLTPPGRGAVAVVLVAGQEALRTVGDCFVPRGKHSLDDVPIGRIVLGRWGGPDGEELVVCRRSEEQIEIHCHGGVAAVEAVIRRLQAEGCQPIAWQELVGRQTSDSIRAAAQIALANAATERTAGILIDQINGALSAAIRAIVAEISNANWLAATEFIEELLGRRELGLHLTEAWRVVVFGEPNVGKSSLINALAGYERSIVSPTPGTTRDVVTVTTAIDGWPVQLADTAGFRTTLDELESAGVELATTTAAKADLVVLVHDATMLGDDEMHGRNKPADLARISPRTIRVINKIDLIPAGKQAELLARVSDSHQETSTAQLVSARTGEGIAELAATIGSMLAPVVPPPGSAVPFANEQINRLTAARAAVERHDAPAATDLLQAMLTDDGFGCQVSDGLLSDV